ncbi:MAG: zf-HC2 domain-containing protein [Actinobacteria bacterium]|nr:zf-HC2 domain-containing protein [Actinomycetota bacterium]MBO0786874.1 zf-HC2 domain-containing protein [Actinomycetota bacterium]MBO0815618.1 zf-HC2 domain-containing protein [Actinomycetota bacterium]
MSQACASWRGDLGAYLVGALDREACAGVRRHLEICPACRAEYEELVPVRDWLGRLAAWVVPAPRDGSWGDAARPGQAYGP